MELNSIIQERDHVQGGGLIGFLFGFVSSQSLWLAVLTAIVCSIAVRVVGVIWDKIWPKKKD